MRNTVNILTNTYRVFHYVLRPLNKLKPDLLEIKTNTSYRLLLLAVPFLLFTGISYGADPYLNFGLGVGLSSVGESQEYSPTDNLMNYYDSDSSKKMIAPLISVEGGYRFKINNKYYTSVGIEGDYIDYGKSKGTLHPGINIDHSFDDLSYSYSTESYLLMLKSKLGFTGRAFFPYVSLGIGMSFNQSSNYSESSVNTAAPAQSLYKRGIKRNLAYSFGLGLYKYEIRNDISLTLAYRFISAGNAVLRNPVTGSDGILSGSLSGHFISLIISIS